MPVATHKIQLLSGSGGGGGGNGSSAGSAAASAMSLRSLGLTNDGVYWIDVPNVGPKQIYCILDPSYDGGGWMMVMKATRGSTFQWSSSYWTTNNVLNEGNFNTNDGDAKFATFNNCVADDIMAIWPDLSANTGCFNSSRGKIWLQNNFNNQDISLRQFFANDTEQFIQDANNFCGISQFSRQVDVRFYGFNYRAAGGLNTRSRWGFGWNENGGGLWPNANETSNDVHGGIGMVHRGGANYSAGDYIGCCQNVSGFNRTARVEMYIR